MTVAPYILRAEQGDARWFLGNLVTVKAGSEQTNGRLTIAEFINPAGFAPPLHRHLQEDEAFYILEGTAEFRSDGHRMQAGPGGFEAFATAVGEPATERRLPTARALDPAALGHAAALHGLEIVGPPPPH